MLHNPGLCLLIEDQDDALAYIKNQVQTVFPNFEIISKRNISETRSWLHQRSQAKVKKPILLALVDLGLPDGSGIEILSELKGVEPDSMNIVLTIHGEDSYLFEALNSGASGYILKSDEPESLGLMLMRLKNNEPPLSPAIARRLLAHFQQVPSSPEKIVTLTPREKEALTYVARGLTVAETAVQMGISRQTVAEYIKIAYQKLHVNNRAQATREAIRYGLITI